MGRLRGRGVARGGGGLRGPARRDDDLGRLGAVPHAGERAGGRVLHPGRDHGLEQRDRLLRARPPGLGRPARLAPGGRAPRPADRLPGRAAGDRLRRRARLRPAARRGAARARRTRLRPRRGGDRARSGHRGRTAPQHGGRAPPPRVRPPRGAGRSRDEVLAEVCAGIRDALGFQKVMVCLPAGRRGADRAVRLGGLDRRGARAPVPPALLADRGAVRAGRATGGLRPLRAQGGARDAARLHARLLPERAQRPRPAGVDATGSSCRSTTATAASSG